MKRGYADTPEGQVHYTTAGEGAPLILLHQTGSSRQYWRLMPLLAKQYKVYALDTLGSGNSDPLPPNVQIPDLARNVVHVMDFLGIPKAHIFGHHTGNKIGTELGASWPQRVDRLILCGHTHSIQAEHQDLVAVLGGRVMPRLQQFEAAPDGSHVVKEWAAEFSRLSAAWWDTATYAHQELTAEMFEHRKEHIVDHLQARGEAEKYGAILAMDLGARMRQIRVKTLIIEVRVPDEAHLSPQGEKLLKLIPGSRLATVEHTAGGIIVEAPAADQLARLILDFLR